jgi:Ni,Fe-hydrogenase III component G
MSPTRHLSGAQRLAAAAPESLGGAAPAWHGRIGAGDLRELASAAAAHGGRLAAFWGTDERDRGGGFALQVVLAADARLHWLEVPLAEGATYPDLSDLFAPANRLQRAVADLIGIAPASASRRRG